LLSNLIELLLRFSKTKRERIPKEKCQRCFKQFLNEGHFHCYLQSKQKKKQKNILVLYHCGESCRLMKIKKELESFKDVSET